MSKKSKNLRYKPTKKFIGIETGLVQAANLLDIAAVGAIAAKDHNLMVDIAAQWLDLSRAIKESLAAPKGMNNDKNDNEDHDHAHPHAAPVGFGVTAQEIKDYHHGRDNKPKS